MPWTPIRPFFVPGNTFIGAISHRFATKTTKPAGLAGKIVDLLFASGHAHVSFFLRLQWVGP